MQISASTLVSQRAAARWSASTSSTRAIDYPGLLRKIIRNLIESWPEQVYRDGMVEAHLFGRRTFYVCDPVLIRRLLVDQAECLVREDFMVKALSPALGRGILTSDGPRWRAQRRTVSPMFRPDSIQRFVPAIEKAVAETALEWRGREAGTVDVLKEMMRTTFDVIVATMIPTEPGLDVTAFGRALDTYLDSVSWKIALTMMGAPAWMPHPGSRKAARAARDLRAALATVVANRRRSGRTGDDLLGLMMRATDPDESAPPRPGEAPGPGIGMSDEALTDNLLTFVAAGHETTALAMAWTFRLLAEHPEIQERARAEIAAASARGRPSLDGLTYTRQVVMEAMRLYPPAPVIVRRSIAPVRLDEATIPAGCSIHIPIYAIHRHRSLWTAPERFDPDRFAPGVERDRYAYLPFGAGPQVCVGMGFALTEGVAILAGLLPDFRFEDPTDPRPEARFKITLRPHGGMPLRVSPRREG